jgi:hypothetical protein
MAHLYVSAIYEYEFAGEFAGGNEFLENPSQFHNVVLFAVKTEGYLLLGSIQTVISIRIIQRQCTYFKN